LQRFNAEKLNFLYLCRNFFVMQKTNLPEGVTRLLLHTCCAPCSSAIVEHLLHSGVRPTIYYYNPNIFPLEEYERRKRESQRHAALLGLDFVDGDYEHDTWRAAVRGYEGEPERGERCLMCFRHRLASAARYAHENSFKAFATTLATSRWKSLEQIAQAGAYAASLFKGLTFLAQNWRKGGLSERRNELVRQYGFYNQQYCGCEYSIRRPEEATV